MEQAKGFVPQQKAFGASFKATFEATIEATIEANKEPIIIFTT